eukprot:1333317-Pyramimonas_sp.AAC.1
MRGAHLRDLLLPVILSLQFCARGALGAGRVGWPAVLPVQKFCSCLPSPWPCAVRALSDDC